MQHQTSSFMEMQHQGLLQAQLSRWLAVEEQWLGPYCTADLFLGCTTQLEELGLG